MFFLLFLYSSVSDGAGLSTFSVRVYYINKRPLVLPFFLTQLKFRFNDSRSSEIWCRLLGWLQRVFKGYQKLKVFVASNWMIARTQSSYVHKCWKLSFTM